MRKKNTKQTAADDHFCLTLFLSFKVSVIFGHRTLKRSKSRPVPFDKNQPMLVKILFGPVQPHNWLSLFIYFSDKISLEVNSSARIKKENNRE